MKKRRFVCWLVFLLLPAFALCACKPGTGNAEPHGVSFFAMDTYMDFRIYANAEAGEGARNIVQEIERRVSVTAPESEIARVNRRETDTVSDQTAQLLKTALELCRFTDGALDISIYPVIRAWGFTLGEFDPEKRYPVPSAAETGALLPLVDYSRIQLSGGRAALPEGTVPEGMEIALPEGAVPEGMEITLPEGMEIDLGGVAKGYAGREAAAYLRKNGVKSALLNLGGNIQTVGAKPDGSPWRVAVQNPAYRAGAFAGPESSAYAGVLEIVDQAAVTSGGYQRYFIGTDGETYWHIMDPSTGRPARNGLISATVVADDGALCDGLSTALFVMGPEAAQAFWRQRGDRDFGMALITEGGEILITPGLSFTLESASGYTLRVLEE